MILKKNYKESVEINKKTDFIRVKEYFPPNSLICYIQKDSRRYDLFQVDNCSIKRTYIVPQKYIIQIRKRPINIKLGKDFYFLWRQFSYGYYSMALKTSTVRKAGYSELFSWSMAKFFLTEQNWKSSY